MSNPLIIYGVQDADGRGPWKPGFSHVWIEDRADLMNLPPWYFEFGRVDMGRRAGEHLGSGCRTLDQLRRWFTLGEYISLLSYGYRCVALRVDRILAGSDIQVVFVRSKPLAVDAIEVNLYGPTACPAGPGQEIGSPGVPTPPKTEIVDPGAS